MRYKQYDYRTSVTGLLYYQVTRSNKKNPVLLRDWIEKELIFLL